MPLSLQLSHLYLSWFCHDGKPSRFSALVTYMNIWMWDGKDMKYFPESQIGKLMQWVEHEDRQVRAVSLCGMVLIVIRYGDILPDYIKRKFCDWAENDRLKEEFIEVQRYLLTSVTGPKMQKKIHDELFSKMHREQEILRQKLGMTEDEEERMEIAEEGNKRMKSFAQKLGNMAQDGVDMNLGTFATLSQQPFFQELKNWFIDFNINHPQLQAVGEKRNLAGALVGHADLCDLDKYALAGIIDKFSATEQLNRQIPKAVLSELSSGNMTEAIQEERRQGAYRYAFQTLFRFFQFSPWKEQLTNPFRLGPFLSDYSILSPMINDNFLWECSQLFIKNSFFSHPAIYLRSWMLHNGQTDEALQMLAHCDKHIGESQERLQCLLELENRHPEDTRLIQETGLCLIQEGRYEDAMQRFFHLEIKEKHLRGSARAIAWCSMMTGNLKRAQRYYQKLMDWEGGPSWEDLLNAGHCAWINGDPIQASALYNRYIALHQDSLTAFDNDYDTLIHLGLSGDDISLMRETIIT